MHIIALTQQIDVLLRKNQRPRLTFQDRLFWYKFAKAYSFWKECLHILKPQTILRWHRLGFKYYWKWKSKTDKRGRPKTPEEIREWIERMVKENIGWGAPKIYKHLRKLGIKISCSTISKYLAELFGEEQPPPSQTWKNFLRNHIKQIAACDFFTVPAWNFAQIYCLVIMSHDRRKILHVDVTRNPTDEWTAKRLNIALQDYPDIKYLIHDNGSNFAAGVKKQLEIFGIEQIKTAYQSPWQNGHCERLIGTIKRECTEHIIPLGNKHLRNILNEYKEYYNHHRCHDALDGDTPIPSADDPPENGAKIISIPHLGGLHHQYKRAA